MSHQYTHDEMVDIILRHVQGMVAFWHYDVDDKSEKEKLEGLAFSILAMLDGANPDIPAFALVPTPHFLDEEYHKENGDNWWPNGQIELNESNIVALEEMLHERYSKYRG